MNNDLGRIRESLVNRDLRPLYVAWLACCGDEDAMEPPVPAGLGELPNELAAMAEFYEVGGDLLAAAERSSSMPRRNDADDSIQNWTAKRTKSELQELVRRMLTLDAAGVRAETLASARREMGTEPWPVAEPTRSFGQLLESQRQERAAAERQRLREIRLAEIAADPNKTLAEVKQLVKTRSTSNYDKAARQLADLREALGGAQGAKRASAAAQQLVKENPTLYRLKSALRKHSLIAK